MVSWTYWLLYHAVFVSPASWSKQVIICWIKYPIVIPFISAASFFLMLTLSSDVQAEFTSSCNSLVSRQTWATSSCQLHARSDLVLPSYNSALPRWVHSPLCGPLRTQHWRSLSGGTRAPGYTGFWGWSTGSEVRGVFTEHTVLLPFPEGWDVEKVDEMVQKWVCCHFTT